MAAIRLTCVFILYVLIVIVSAQNKNNTNLSIKVQAFKPKGLSITVDGDQNATFIMINTSLSKRNINVSSDENDLLFHKNNNSWILKKPLVELGVGDRVLVDVFLGTSNTIFEGDLKDQYNATFTGYGFNTLYAFVIDQLEELAMSEKKCFVITQLPDKDVCSDNILLDEDFNDILEEKWRIEQYIPVEHPEFPFVSYQNLNSTVFVKDGQLHIQPTMQTAIPGFDDETISSGTLNLHSGCTGRVCAVKAMGPNIIPPIVSGRISSRFAFKYGTVHIRAKVPIGDWIYPELLLEPMSHKYGSLHYSSGVLKIAMIRGNQELNKPKSNNKVLRGGPILNSKCRGVFDFYTKETSDGKSWGDDFHVYSVTWSPGFIEMSVDGKVWVTYRPGSGGLRSWLPKSCRNGWYNLLERAPVTSKIAPFDDYFFVSIGVAVGGTFEFPDDFVTGGGREKPWKNNDPRAMVDFWNARSEWLPTWTQPELVVDYVKIIAL